MSSAKTSPAKEPASLHNTRQMLDELDALMDRMLALPVNDLEDDVAPPHEIVRMPGVSATFGISESALEEEAARERPRTVWQSYTADLGQTPPPPVYQEAPQQEYGAEPDPIPDEAIPPTLMNLQVPVIAPALPMQQLRFPRRSLTGVCLLPLLWANQSFDRATTLLGPPGAWLRSQGGRHFLGVTGLALLAIAGLWLVKDWLGWTW